MSSGSQIITEYSGASRETLVSTNSFNEDVLILFAAMVSFPQAHLPIPCNFIGKLQRIYFNGRFSEIDEEN
jgi:hypothetical protein